MNEFAIAEAKRTKLIRRIEHMCSFFGKKGTALVDWMNNPEECKHILLDVYLQDEEKQMIANLPKEDFDFVMSEIKYFIDLWNAKIEENKEKNIQREILESFLEGLK